MALLNQSVQVPNQLGKFFEAIRAGQAPERFTQEHLKSLGFTSSNHFAFIPLLKGLGLLSPDGIPTEYYKAFLDKTQWKRVLGRRVREAYSDVFTLKSDPQKSDRDMIAGKFKSTFNVSDLAADRAASTFLALWELSDKSEDVASVVVQKAVEAGPEPTSEQKGKTTVGDGRYANNYNMHYNIQIHLPASKDIEVYNAIFKSIRTHLYDD